MSVLTITSPNDPGSRACFLAPSTPSPSADASVIGWIWPTPEPYHWPQRRLCLGQYRETRQKLPILVAGSKFARLAAGGNRIRTIGPTEKETAVERGPAADHRRLASRPVLNNPIQLIGPASLVGNSRETFHQSGTDGSNPVPSSRESCELAISRRIADCLSRSRTARAAATIISPAHSADSGMACRIGNVRKAGTVQVHCPPGARTGGYGFGADGGSTGDEG